MIKIQRTAKPASLANNETRWLAELIQALNTGTKERIKIATNRYAQSDVKQELELIFNGKCAFCESEINCVSYGHIEHYKPKSKYHDLTFSWDNMLLSCARCNGKSHKGDKFPLATEGGPIVDPSAEDPNDFFDFIYDPKTKLALIGPKNQRGITTEDIFKLNTRKALLKRRSDLIRKLMLIKSESKNNPEAMEIIELSKKPESEFSAWAKKLL